MYIYVFFVAMRARVRVGASCASVRRARRVRCDAFEVEFFQFHSILE
jgi:hypothetical protein